MKYLLFIGSLCSTPTSTSLSIDPQGCVVSQGEPNMFGAVIYSPALLPETPFGEGLLCLNPWAPGSGRIMFEFDEHGEASTALPPVGMNVQAFSRTLAGFTTSDLEVWP